jgi:DNA-binding transcriptional regulator YdaS (Cro superfamily)
MARRDPLARVLEIVGNRHQLALRLDVQPSAVHKWRRIPTERVLTVSQITGIPPHELRPDLPALFPAPSR